MSTAGEDPLERRRDELLELVYGPAGEPSDEIVAELAALEAELVARRGDADRVAAPAPTEPTESMESTESTESTEPTEPTESPGSTESTGSTASPDRGPTGDSGATTAGGLRRPMRPTRTVAIASAILVLIAAWFLLVEPVRGLLSPARGLGTFERPPTVEEQLRAADVAAAAGLEPAEAVTLRAVGRLFGHEFWVHRDARDRVCLLSRREFWFDWIDECVSLAEFEEAGLSRSIAGDDIRDDARPARIRPDDVVIVRWGPRSLDVGWDVEPAP